jgi:hypothetical protein
MLSVTTVAKFVSWGHGKAHTKHNSDKKPNRKLKNFNSQNQQFNCLLTLK